MPLRRGLTIAFWRGGMKRRAPPVAFPPSKTGENRRWAIVKGELGRAYGMLDDGVPAVVDLRVLPLRASESPW